MYSLILHGRKSVELQKLHHLRVSVQNVLSAFSSSFSSASAAAAEDISPRHGRKGNVFTVYYLVESLGLTTKLAESIWRKVSFEEKGNPDSVLSLFRSHGFTDSHISTIVTTYPQVLTLDAEKVLAPKLQLLQSRAASNSELADIVSTVPKILGKKVGKTISRYYDFVREVIEGDKSSRFEELCHSSFGAQENIIRNISLLRELGMPRDRLFSLLISNHSLVCGKEKFEESLKMVFEMGFDPTTTKFLRALRVVYGSSDKTMEEKIDVYKRLGLSVEDVWEMFKVCPQSLGVSEKNISNSVETFLGLGFTRDDFALIVKRYPSCIGYSAETVKKKIEFLVKKTNWTLKDVVSNPAVLGYSLDNRTAPRCNVIKDLISKGLIASKLPPMSHVLSITDQAFLNKYVMNHDDKQLVPELIAILTKGCNTH